ncbi:hypothetical protein B0H17DRAFT_1040450, partial [Mycena rosella]
MAPSHRPRPFEFTRQRPPSSPTAAACGRGPRGTGSGLRQWYRRASACRGRPCPRAGSAARFL